MSADEANDEDWVVVVELVTFVDTFVVDTIVVTVGAILLFDVLVCSPFNGFVCSFDDTVPTVDDDTSDVSAAGATDVVCDVRLI